MKTKQSLINTKQWTYKEELYVRLEALKAQLMGEYGLEREKQQAIQVAEEKIRQNKIYLKQDNKTNLKP